MKILKLSFTDECQGWCFKDFSLDHLTLLVGASGTGKTQIIHALTSLAEVAQGGNVDGVKWDVMFQVHANEKLLTYRWIGESQRLNVPVYVRLWEENIKSKILHEKIFVEEELIAERRGSDIFLEGKETVKLSQYTSIINLLKEENIISRAYRAFKKIVLIDRTTGDDLKNIKKHTYVFGRSFMDNSDYDTVDKIRRSNYDTIVKLDMVRQIKSEVYKDITDRFKEIFPQIMNIKIAPLTDAKGYMSSIPFVQIKEKGSLMWIPQFDMSAGMCRTLTQIAEMYLCQEGTLFLIDEFENSLGVNCMEDLTIDVLTTERDLQFILSSHNAYIINNIDIKSWRLVSRVGGEVFMRPVSELIDEESAHDYFMQLMQLDEYRSGRR